MTTNKKLKTATVPKETERSEITAKEELSTKKKAKSKNGATVPAHDTEAVGNGVHTQTPRTKRVLNTTTTTTTPTAPTTKGDNAKHSDEMRTAKKRKKAEKEHTENEGSPFDDLKRRLDETSTFFDSILDTIPPGAYFPVEEMLLEKHRNQANKKVSQRLRTVSGIQKRKAAEMERLREAEKEEEEEEEEEEDSSEEEEEDEVKKKGKKKQPKKGTNGTGLLGTLLLSAKNGENTEELHKKLQDRISQLRAQRKAKEGEPPRKKQKKEKQKKQKEKTKKKKKSEEEEEEEEDDVEEEEEEVKKQEGKKEESEDEPDIKFGTFQFSSGKPTPSYLVKKKKTSDAKLLEQLQKEKELLEQLKGTKEGAKLERKLILERALKKASGEKVKDDLMKLKKSIKLKEKKKAKSKQEWNERIKKLKEDQASKQEKRQENIEKHLQANKEKRLQRMAKRREKRAGFEGKRQDFLNKKGESEE